MATAGTTGRERARRQRRVFFLCCAVVLITAVGIAALRNLRAIQKAARYAPQALEGALPGGIRRVAMYDPLAARMVNSAKAQLGTRYNAGYRVISYPNGDVPSSGGACTDVIVRSMRAAKIDLQKLVHQDMSANFSLYPRQWGLSRPDKNIDHRRVPNQMKFFSRFGQTLTTRVDNATLKTWKPGDVVYWDMQNGQLHTGIISDGLNNNGIPLVIHNGWLCVEDDSLTRWKIIGHYRYPKRQPLRRP